MITIEGVELLTMEEVAEKLGISMQALRRKVRQGHYTPVSINRSRYIAREQLQNYLKTGGK